MAKGYTQEVVDIEHKFAAAMRAARDAFEELQTHAALASPTEASPVVLYKRADKPTEEAK